MSKDQLWHQYPEPWEIVFRINDEDLRGPAITSDGRAVATNVKPQCANLIAAAPELYEALEMAERHLMDYAALRDPKCDWADIGGTASRARLALAKARGET